MKPSRLFLGVCILLSVTLLMGLGLLYRTQSGASEFSQREVSRSLTFSGEYRIGPEGDWHSLSSGTSFRDAGTQTVFFQGHFSQDMAPGENLSMWLTNAELTLKVNGSLLFCSGLPGSYPVFFSAPGSIWCGFATSGIRTSDTVEFSVRCAYADSSDRTIHTLLDNLLAGSVQSLYTGMIGEHLPDLAVFVVLLALGFILLLVGILLAVFRNRTAHRVLLLSGFAIACGFWLLANYDMISLLWPYPALNTLLDQFWQPMIAVFVILLFAAELTDRRKVWCQRFAAVLLAFVCVQAVLQGTGTVDFLRIQNLQFTAIILCVLFCVPCLFLEARSHPDSHARFTLLEFLPSILGAFLAIWFYCRTLKLWYRPLQLGILITVILLTADLCVSYFRAQRLMRETRQKEIQLTQQQIAVTLNHLQPHFLYNALNAIQYLCEEEPVQAAAAVENLTVFLHGNMASLKNSAPVPFSQEFRHLKAYVSLEILRFGERIQVQYDIQVTDFFLPALTLQPLVENSIRFGITKKPQCGTIRISTADEGNRIRITIADNGTGFDPREELDGGRSHIDVLDVENRLRVQCGGSLDFLCIPGEGTTVNILIPKGMKHDANHGC